MTNVPVFASNSAVQKAYKMYYTHNKTMDDIAEVFNTTKTTVKNLFRRMGWIARDRVTCQAHVHRWTEDLTWKYIQEYQSGKSLTKIASIHGINANRLSSILKSLNLFEEESIRQRHRRLKRIRKFNQRKLLVKDEQSSYIHLVTIMQFQHVVRYLTLRMKDRVQIPRKRLPEYISWHLDHMYSIHDAYYSKVARPASVFELAHPVNLEYLMSHHNGTKNNKSSITLSELRRRIKTYNAAYGDPFAEITIRGRTNILYHPSQCYAAIRDIRSRL